MPTRNRSQHDIRPRVVSAVLRLQKFTAQEIVSAANLTDRKQAYAQLARLEKEEMIRSHSVPSRGPGKTKLYTITPVKDATRKLAQEVTRFGLEPVVTDLGARNVALDRGGRLLSTVEEELHAIRPSDLKSDAIEDVKARMKTWENQLAQTELEIETAKIESGSPDDQGISQLSFRLVEARQSLRHLEDELHRRKAAIWLRSIAENWHENIKDPLRWLREVLEPLGGGRAAEIVFDSLLQGLRERESMPAVLASHALRTNDLKLIYACLSRQPREEPRWWRYNQANALFLMGKYGKAYESWKAAYRDLAQKNDPPQVCRPLGVFIYEPRNLTQSALRPLLEKYDVSIVSPCTLNFWNFDEEIVRPLFVDPVSELCSEAGPLTSTLSLKSEEASGPVWVLFAYGPLTAIIRQWPGAPALRVVASLDKITPAEIDTPRIVDSLRAERGVIVLGTNKIEDITNVRHDAAEALGQLEEISVSATAGES